MAAKQNKLSEAEEIQKKATTKTVVGGINTNVSITKTQKEYYQRFVNLSVNEKPLPQGDATIRITPFDDFYLFTLFDEIDGEDTPIDLSNVGSLFLNFIGDTDDIDIKNHTQVEEVDLSQGEVLFRITRSNSKKILALNNNNFYISTKMVDPTDGSTSDESVIYQGLWLAASDANRISLTSQIEEQRLEYSIELAKLQAEITDLKAQIAELVNSAAEDDVTIEALRNSNEELTNEVAELSKDLKSTTVELINKRAKLAQEMALKQIKKRQQILAIKNSAKIAQTKSKKRFFYRNAAKNLVQYTIGRNLVSTIKDDFFRNRNNQ
jgi:cell division protein FtsB|tara:strand:+ start:486 stop:1454 length:969 start_codon:yes stop_codon:yes gene_type:complete